MTIQFRMPIEKYRDFCLTFFSKFGAGELNAKIAAMSLDEVPRWTRTLAYEYHAACCVPVEQLEKQLRGQDNPSEGCASHALTKDPLDEPENKELFSSYREVRNNVFDEYFKTLPAYVEQMNALQNYVDAHQREQLLNIEVEGQRFRALTVMPVLWNDWAGDAYVWVVQDGDKKRLVTTNHGLAAFVDKSFLESKIQEYKTAISGSEEMLLMLGYGV